LSTFGARQTSAIGLAGLFAILTNALGFLAMASYAVWATSAIVLVPVAVYALLVWLRRAAKLTAVHTALVAVVIVCLGSFAMHFLAYGSFLSAMSPIVVLGTAVLFVLGPLIIALPLAPFAILISAAYQSGYSPVQSIVSALAGAGFGLVWLHQYTQQVLGTPDKFLTLRLSPVLVLVAVGLSIAHIGGVARMLRSAIYWAAGMDLRR
jgi:hypothetical protein